MPINPRNPSLQLPIANDEVNLTPDVRRLFIEQLNTETGEIQDSLSLYGTHRPFQPFQFSTRQDIKKIYYPGGPPDREPTSQVLGSEDMDITFRGIWYAKRLPRIENRGDPLLIARKVEQFLKAGKPCRITMGFYIKYVLLSEFRPMYKLDSEVEWELICVVLGDRNPITGVVEERDESLQGKIFEQEVTEDDISDIINSIVEDIQNAQKEAMDVFGYDLGRCKGGLLGPATSFCEAYLDFFRNVNRIVDSVDKFVDRVERTAQIVRTMLLQVQALRSRIYKTQIRLFNSYLEIKAAANLKRQVDALNVLSLVSGLANNMNTKFKQVEDSVRNINLTSIRGSYTIVDGDTYQSISTRQYNTVDRWKDIQEFNIGIPLEPGRTILIPE